jgi:hypothetical protein
MRVRRKWRGRIIAAFSIIVVLFIGGYISAMHLMRGMIEFSAIETKGNNDGVSYSVFSGSGGATTSVIYKLYIHPTEQSPGKDDLISIIDKVTSVRAIWVDSATLKFCTNNGRIFKFQNFKPVKINNEFNYIRIILQEGGPCS